MLHDPIWRTMSAVLERRGRRSGTPGASRVATALLASQVVLAGGAFVVNVLAARGLGPAGRGELALLLNVAYASNLLCLLGRHRSYLTMRTSDHSLARAHREMSVLARLPIVIAVLIAAGTAAFFGLAVAAFAALFMGLALKMASGVLVNTHRAAAIVARNGKPYLLATLATQVLLVLVTTYYLAVGVESVALWVTAYGATAAVPYLIAEIAIRHREPAHQGRVRDLWEARSIGLRLMPANVAETLLKRSDRFLIPVFSTFEQLGIYAVVTTMIGLLEWPVRQYADSKTPEWSDRFKHGTLRAGREIMRGALASSGMTVVVGGTVALVLVPIFGEEYRQGMALIIPLAIAHTGSAIAVIGTSMAVAVQKPSSASSINIAGIVVSLPAYAILIGPYGAEGAAWGSALGYLASSVVTAALYVGPRAVQRRQVDL